jgi:hypothetical protein
MNLTTSTSSNPQVIIGSTITIKCNVHGVPSPKVQWLLNNQALDARNKRYRILDNGYQLEIANTEISDSGRYTCIAKNDAGIVDRDFDLDVLGEFSVKFALTSWIFPKVFKSTQLSQLLAHFDLSALRSFEFFQFIGQFT